MTASLTVSCDDHSLKELDFRLDHVGVENEAGDDLNVDVDTLKLCLHLRSTGRCPGRGTSGGERRQWPPWTRIKLKMMLEKVEIATDWDNIEVC